MVSEEDVAVTEEEDVAPPSRPTVSLAEYEKEAAERAEKLAAAVARREKKKESAAIPVKAKRKNPTGTRWQKIQHMNRSGIRRTILKTSNMDRVGASAVNYLEGAAESQMISILKEAGDLCKQKGRKIINDKDVNTALNMYYTRTRSRNNEELPPGLLTGRERERIMKTSGYALSETNKRKRKE